MIPSLRSRRRPWLWVLLGAGLFALLLIAAWFWPAPRARIFALTGEEALPSQVRGFGQWLLNPLRPLPNTADAVPIAYADLSPFGVNTFLEQEVELVKREQTVQMIADAGFAWIRQSFPWYDLEIHGKDDYEDRRWEPYRSAWDKYDTIVALAEQYELGIIARLEAPPAWTRADGTARGAFAPPDDLTDYGDYVAAVAARYRGRIRFYQIWNEPNIYPEWGNQPVDPVAYTEMLCLAYRRIKAADPDAVIITGALAPTAELGSWNPAYEGNNLMDTVFLQRMYDAGAGDCFDILAVNAYMLRSGPTDRRMRPDLINFARPVWVRDVMVANGDATKPVWISEMNSNAVPDGLPDTYGRVTLEQQARYAVLAYERIQREWPWAGVTTVWFFKRATDAELDQPMYYFRMVEPDFTPLPLYTALHDYLTTLEPTLYPGAHQATAWQLAYTGAWDTVADPVAELGSYRRALQPGASVALRWEGRALTLHPGPGAGTIAVTVADGAPRTIALDGRPVVVARALLPGAQHLTLTAQHGDVTLDAFHVD